MNQEYIHPFILYFLSLGTFSNSLNSPYLISLAIFLIPLNLFHHQKYLVLLLKFLIVSFIPNINHDPLLFLSEINSLMFADKTFYLKIWGVLWFFLILRQINRQNLLIILLAWIFKINLFNFDVIIANRYLIKNLILIISCLTSTFDFGFEC